MLRDSIVVDDVNRAYRWSKDDESRLNMLNEQARNLQMPNKWTRAAKEGTDQPQAYAVPGGTRALRRSSSTATNASAQVLFIDYAEAANKDTDTQNMSVWIRLVLSTVMIVS